MNDNVFPDMIRRCKDHNAKMQGFLRLQLDALSRQTFEWHIALNDRIVERLLPLL